MLYYVRGTENLNQQVYDKKKKSFPICAIVSLFGDVSLWRQMGFTVFKFGPGLSSVDNKKWGSCKSVKCI